MLSQLLLFVLKNNIFLFTNQYCVQLYRIAMGTKLAPALATLFLSVIEENYIKDSVYKPILWKIYIDDVFLIWDNTCDHLDNFISGLNHLKPRLRFTATIYSDSVICLDLVI